MPDVEQELARFGRWLDTEIATEAGGEVQPWAPPPESRRRRLRRIVVLAAAAAVLVLGLLVVALRPHDQPAISPGPSAPGSPVASTDDESSASTTAVPTTFPRTTTTVAPTSTEPTTIPTTTAPTTNTPETSEATVAPATSAATDPLTSSAPGIPPAVDPTTSTAPEIATTEPVTTAPSPTTSPAATCGQPLPQAVGRNGNVFFYKTCSDGIRYSGVSAAAGWQANVTARGPSAVSVSFSNGSASLSCTLTYEPYDKLVFTSGDC